MELTSIYISSRSIMPRPVWLFPAEPAMDFNVAVADIVKLSSLLTRINAAVMPSVLEANLPFVPPGLLTVNTPSAYVVLKFGNLSLPPMSPMVVLYHTLSFSPLPMVAMAVMLSRSGAM